MKMFVNEQNEIEVCITAGDMEGSIEIDNTPEGFLETFQPCKYLYVDGKIVQNPDYKPLPLSSDIRKIERLKYELQQSDYKVRKCMEYSLLGLELPYDINQIHEESQVLRDEINGLEQKH